jgi:hypothetical protein
MPRVHAAAERMMRTMGGVHRLHVLNRRLAPRVHQADMALAADRQQAVAQGQAHHLLAVLQLHLQRRAPPPSHLSARAPEQKQR